MLLVLHLLDVMRFNRLLAPGSLELKRPAKPTAQQTTNFTVSEYSEHASEPPAIRRAAFKGYLGDDERAWHQYDASELLAAYAGPTVPILVDQVWAWGGLISYFRWTPKGVDWTQYVHPWD
jgi:hypothetical protein